MTSKIEGSGNLFIIGNGFDIDLGFPTTYRDFVNNNNAPEYGEFPFRGDGAGYYALGRFIQQRATINNWYGLEDILAKYGSLKYISVNEDPQETEKENRNDYELLVSRLFSYLNSLDYKQPNQGSVAARILRMYKDATPTVYSFNYTNLVSIASALGLYYDEPYYVHGSLKNKNIILGVGDYAELGNTADFMYKTSNPCYRSSQLFEDLDKCETVIIFGLSLSRVDYPYFEGFFKKIASGAYHAKKYVRIITASEHSKMEILRNLRRMNDGMISLFNNSDFDIIRTKDDIDEEKVIALIDRIAHTKCASLK